MPIIFPSGSSLRWLPACDLWRAAPKYCKGERGEVGSTPARRRLASENQYLGVSVLSGFSVIPGSVVCTKKPASFHGHALVGRWRVVLRVESVCRQQIVLLGEERASSAESLGGKVQFVKPCRYHKGVFGNTPDWSLEVLEMGFSPQCWGENVADLRI